MKTQAHDLSESLVSPKYSLTQLTVEEFHQFWPGIESMLDKVPHTWRHWTKDYIVSAVEVGALQVWGIGPPPIAVLTFFTQVGVYPAMKVLHIVWAAGTFHREMLPLMDASLTNYARLNECSAIEIRGRRGWNPHLKAIGFRRESENWMRPVQNVRMN
jgi:hypothetical protein